MDKRTRRICSILLVLMLLSAVFIATPEQSDAQGVVSDDEKGVDYVLVLDCTITASDSDKAEDSRKAAAKLFIDLLPIDNARVAVFAIGQKSPGYKDSYKLRADEGHIANAEERMQCVYLLWDMDDPIGTKQSREVLKDKIDEVYERNQGAFSDTHCGLYAAMDTLKYYDTESACVLLIAEEHSAEYRLHKEIAEDGTLRNSDHTMLQDVKSCFDQKKSEGKHWSVSWINLARSQSESTSSQVENRKDLIELCEGNSNVSAENFENIYQDEKIVDLPRSVATVIGKFSGADNDQGDNQTLGADGLAEITLKQFTMLTEINIVVTGDGVDKISVQDSKGKITDEGDHSDVLWFSKEYNPKNPTQFFYSALKMILPDSSGCKILIEGEPGSQIYFQTIRTLEPDLLLMSNTESGAEIKVGQAIEFVGKFQYAGKDLACGEQGYRYYHPEATIICENAATHATQNIDMEVNGEQYTATYVANTSGVYSFRFVVRGNEFKTGEKQSNVIANISVDNRKPVALGEIPDLMEIKVGTTAERIDLRQYFDEPDGETMKYELICTNDRGARFQTEIDENDYLIITVPVVDGIYEMEIYAEDQNGGRSETLAFKIGVINRPPTVSDLPRRIELVANVPEILLKIGLITEEEGLPRSMDLTKAFTDPDGLPLSYTVDDTEIYNEDGEAVIVFGEEGFQAQTGTFTIVPTAQGKAVLVVGAVDSANSSATHEITIVVKSVFSAMLQRYWIYFAILALLIMIIVILLASRRVRGTWTINAVDTQSGESCFYKIESMASCASRRLRKTKVPVKEIVAFAVRNTGPDSQIDISVMSYDGPILVGTVMGVKCKVDYRTQLNNLELSLGEQVLDQRRYKYVMKKGQALSLKYFVNDSYGSRQPVLDVTLTLS